MNERIPLEIGQQWRHHDGSPWPSEAPPVVIEDLKEGWVKFAYVKAVIRDRFPEELFRKHYNQLVE